MKNRNISLRAIKSYVRRSGRLTPAQKKALVDYWPLYAVDFQPSLINLAAITSGFEALKLEIGFGSGEALISMAQNDPKSFYLGIEVHEAGVGRCLNSIHDCALTNVKLIKHDAIEVMQYMLPAQSLDRVFLFFPDPWPKKRHHKRRIVNRQFRDLLCGLLKPGACLHMATDWQDYAEYMAAEMISDARYKNLGDENGYTKRPAYRPVTRFENRGLKLGHGVWDLVFQK
ncbi:MAG: tRNA (guanosine(46)-N7)-methyltransferase TrmB [Proteobacteria bacterium]|nr:tRNA (guanosine(46)-N7)-methyltransferase TrmB [Pseudomonadota bacterium]